MAEIHLARVTGAAGFEKLVVVKRLLPDLAEEKEFVAQFVDEARLAATFSHGNIVTTFDFGESDGNYFIAMEYVEGKNLRRIADALEKRGKKLPEAAAVHIIAEACRGLDYAHQRKDNSGRVLGIVHRDVSPQNLVVSYSGDVKVLDFGIAKSAAREYHTAAGIVKGKLRYMAPEQVTGEPIDGRADLFAAAVVLWELLYGRRVMPDMPDTELVEWVARGEFVRPPDIDIGSTVEIDAILAKALEVNPANRYATCSEFAMALNRHNITRWPHWTSHELGKMLETEFSDDARKEREWISHILGQMAEADAKRIQVELDTSIPASMKVLEVPSRDDIPTTSTPSGGVKQPARGQPTLLKAMEPDSGNTLSGFHVKAKDGAVPVAAPAAAPSRVGMLPPSRSASPERGANTEISIPMIQGTPIVQPTAAQLLNTGDDEPGVSGATVPLTNRELPSPAKQPWLLVGGIGAGLLAAALAAFVLPSVLTGHPTATPTPIAAASPIATVTPYLPVSATPAIVIATPTPAIATPTPTQTQVAMKSPTPRVATPMPTKRVVVPTPPLTPNGTPTPKIVNAAYLSVNVTSGWASVYVNDKLVDEETPLRELRLAAGKHVVTVVKNGRKRSETIVLRPGEQRTLLLDLP